MTAPTKSTSPTAAVGAGRGLVFITFAKLWFMVMGYVVQFALPRALGSPAKWGIWVLVLSAVSPVNNVMITATIQGVSKFVSEEDTRSGAVVRAALRLQAFVAGGSALAFFLLAPVIAGFWLDPSLVGELRIASGVILLYGFYAVFVGAANGARAFHKQAGLDVASSTLRTVMVVGAAYLFHEAKDSLAGWVVAALAILLVSMAVVGFGDRGTVFPWQRLGKFMSGLVGFLLILNLLMFVDGLLLKRLVAEAAARAGAADPALVANTAEGYYGAVQAVARLPYQLILAVTFVVFPLVSRATFEADRERARGYVRVTMRYSLVVVALLGSVLAVRPAAVLGLLYKPEYGVGQAALGVLAIGYVCFSMFSIACTVLNSAGRVLPSLVLGSATLVIAAAANWIVVPKVLAAGGDALLAAASATTVAMALGMLASGVWLQRQFGAFLSPLSVLRVGAAVAAAWAVGRAWPSSGFLGGKVGTLLSMSASGLAFMVVAIVSRELDLAEIVRARRQK